MDHLRTQQLILLPPPFYGRYFHVQMVSLSTILTQCYITRSTPECTPFKNRLGQKAHRWGQNVREKKLFTSCLFSGSLKALLMISLVGTIFHVGTTLASLINMATTSGGGFTFSAIWKGQTAHYIINK